MNRKDAFASFDIRTVNDHTAVKSSRTKQRRIEHVGPVRRGDQDHAVVRLEAVHLDQQLVESLFTLVVPAAETRASMTTHGVDFIDEDNAGRVLFALLKQIADTGRADPDE